jgi:predicted RNase H-like HicB family nuclease
MNAIQTDEQVVAFGDEPNYLSGKLETFADRVYRCRVLIANEPDGYSVRAAELAGVASQGENVGEAIANIKEACAGSIESYIANGEEIPWLNPPREPQEGEKMFSLEVHV